MAQAEQPYVDMNDPTQAKCQVVKIVVRDPDDGFEASLSVDDNAPIYYIRDAYCGAYYDGSFDVGRVGFVHNGRPLDLCITVKEAGIEHGAILLLMEKSAKMPD